MVELDLDRRRPGARLDLTRVPELRMRRTVGGNLGSSTPAGDALPPLLAAHAAVEIASATRGTRLRPRVRSVGGASEAAKLVVGARTVAERSRLLTQARNIAGASVLDFSGITQIEEGCF